MNNLVSIIVPCYNQAQFLDEALQSVLDQTYTNWECIIVNDGSPDHTEELANKWVDRDNRFIYLHKENGGLSSARNAGLEVAKGEYIQFLDSDDWIAATKLELSISMLMTAIDKNVKIAISNFGRFIDKIDEPMVEYGCLNEECFNFDSMLYKWDETFAIPIHCALFEKTLFQNFKFPESLKAKEDWIMWVSLFYKDCKAVHVDEPLALYRRNPDSITMTKDMFPDFMRACEYFRDFLSVEEYNTFSLLLISRYYKLYEDYKCRLKATKDSNSHQTGLLIKKVLKTVGLLKLSKQFFPIILKFKTK